MVGGDMSFGSLDAGIRDAQELMNGSPMPAFMPHPEMEGPGDGTVSFLDSPTPYSHFRLRYDNNNNLQRPERGEYFWAKPGPSGPGVRLPETSVDYQDISLYAECACSQRLSFFAEAPLRFLNPEVNPNESGFVDLQAGTSSPLFSVPSFRSAAKSRDISQPATPSMA